MPAQTWFHLSMGTTEIFLVNCAYLSTKTLTKPITVHPYMQFRDGPIPHFCRYADTGHPKIFGKLCLFKYPQVLAVSDSDTADTVI